LIDKIFYPLNLGGRNGVKMTILNGILIKTGNWKEKEAFLLKRPPFLSKRVRYLQSTGIRKSGMNIK